MFINPIKIVYRLLDTMKHRDVLSGVTQHSYTYHQLPFSAENIGPHHVGALQQYKHMKMY
jgi:hypothetical protein